MRSVKLLFILFLITFLKLTVSGQISPGDLTEPHAHLEGISNCTKCHELGEKVSPEKCLACHKEIKSRIDQRKGFHASAKVDKKSCFVCHGDHHGRKYDIVHLDKEKFDHSATGYILEGKHKEKKCAECHKPERIADQEIKKKKMTFLGLSIQCISCHEDYHQKTLSTDCASCHSNESFKPAPKFDHSKSKFVLKGKHQSVDCSKCHEVGTQNGKKFQRFKGLQFSNCVNCHKDVHENKFGQNCTECHSEESFKAVKTIGAFDHNKADYKLEGKHVNVACKLCHKISLTAPLKYKRCTDCHSDYHKGQFVKNGVVSDCSDCHSQKGFQGSSFTFERHNNTSFKLEGAHVATPCISCHLKGKEWQFRSLEKTCSGCHTNVHKGFISEKFIPENRCDKCHVTSGWGKVTFDHQNTNFELKGKHLSQSCRNCHYKRTTENQAAQQFSILTGNCEECHADVHQKQFEVNGKVNCTSCHGGFENWSADRFNHNLTRFKLNGGHKGVDCKKCHLENKTQPIPFIQYKNTGLKCIDCHI